MMAAKRVDQRLVDAMRTELDTVAHDPQAVFFYAFVQAEARA